MNRISYFLSQVFLKLTSVCLSTRDSFLDSFFLTTFKNLSIYLSIYLSICLSVCLSVCLQEILFWVLSFLQLLSVYLSIRPSIHQSIHIYIYVCVCVCVCVYTVYSSLGKKWVTWTVSVWPIPTIFRHLCVGYKWMILNRHRRRKHQRTSQISLIHMLPEAIVYVKGCVRHERLKYTHKTDLTCGQ